MFFKVQEPLALGSNKQKPLKKTVFESAYYALAHYNRIDPFRQYLSSLSWDRTERLESFLSRIFEIEPEHEPIAKWGLKSLLLAAVWRTFIPGCKHDEFLVLRGPQGIGKTSLLETLFKNKSFYSSSASFSDNNNTFFESISGKVIIEIPELAGLRKAELERIKNLITERQDTVRLAYRPDPKDYPRRCVFAGTTNDITPIPDDGTGNRRFILVSLKKKKGWTVDKMKTLLKKERDQLWAEAVIAFKNNVHGTLS